MAKDYQKKAEKAQYITGKKNIIRVGKIKLGKNDYDILRPYGHSVGKHVLRLTTPTQPDVPPEPIRKPRGKKSSLRRQSNWMNNRFGKRREK